MADYFKIEAFKENVQGYLEAKTELVKIQVQEKIEDGFARLAYALIKIVLIAIFALAFLLLLGGVLNYYFDSRWLGFGLIFLITGGIWLAWQLFPDFFLDRIRKQIQKANEKSDV